MADLDSAGRRPTRAGRLVAYVEEMFPTAASLPYAAGVFAALYFGAQALDAVTPLVVSWRAVLGAATVYLFLLLLRIYDELKDVETDLRLGKAGDPRYRDRAIVQGRVDEADIVWLRWAVTALLVVLNVVVLIGLPASAALATGVAFALLFVVTWLSYRWFFWPAIAKNLLLAFATHNPMTILLVAYVLVLTAADIEAVSYSPWWWGLAIVTWWPVAAWEVSRKVRIPGDETDYDTYSRRLGWKVAAVIPMLLCVAIAAVLFPLAAAMQLSPIFPAMAAVAALVMTAGVVRLIVAPSTRASNLRPLGELFMVVTSAGLSIALLVQHGVR